MEDRRNGQQPEAEAASAADATAGRTRPIDAPETTPSDAATARAAARDAEATVDAMHERGFGSHKGTEAD